MSPETLTLNQIAAAINSLGRFQICYRGSGSPTNCEAWYVTQPGVEIKDGSILRSVSGSGLSPDDALVEHWHNITTDLAVGMYLVTNAASENKRRAVKWNGFMWGDITED